MLVYMGRAPTSNELAITSLKFLYFANTFSRMKSYNGTYVYFPQLNRADEFNCVRFFIFIGIIEDDFVSKKKDETKRIF